MGSVQNARTAVEVLTQQRGKVLDARTAVEVLTQQRGYVRDARTAVEVLTQQRGKVLDARTAVEVLLTSRGADSQFQWGQPWELSPLAIQPAGFVVNALDGLNGGTFNILLPGDADVGDMAIVSYGHRNLTAIPSGCAFRASSLGGQSTANQQTCRVHTKILDSTDVTNGYITCTAPTGTVYGLTYSVQLMRSPHPDYHVEFDVAAFGPTNTNGTSKTTPAMTFGGPGRHVFHQATFFQNSGGVKTWTFPTANDQAQSSINREYGGCCRETYDPAALTSPARTWTISGGVNGGVGTTAVAVYLAPN